jgi:hypothetical protein
MKLRSKLNVEADLETCVIIIFHLELFSFSCRVPTPLKSVYIFPHSFAFQSSAFRKQGSLRTFLELSLFENYGNNLKCLNSFYTLILFQCISLVLGKIQKNL